MIREDMLTRLVADAHEGGHNLTSLRAIVEEASEMGATRALDRLGLADAEAGGDLGELRELLQAWRDAKASAWRAALHWLLRGVMALLLIGIAVRLGVGEVLK